MVQDKVKGGEGTRLRQGCCEQRRRKGGKEEEAEGQKGGGAERQKGGRGKVGKGLAYAKATASKEGGNKKLMAATSCLTMSYSWRRWGNIVLKPMLQNARWGVMKSLR